MSVGNRFSIGGMPGTGAGMAFRLLRGRLGESRELARGLRPRMQAFWKPISHVLRILFLEISGLVFLCLALTVVGAVWREYQKYAAHQSSPARVALAGSIAAMFLYFGVTSLWRARRKRSRTQA